MTLAVFLAQMIEKLRQAGIDNPQLDARLLFCHALHCDRAQLLSQSDRLLTAQEIAAIEEFFARRLKRESVARIVGYREFWGLEFGLNEATLEPRPDSEILIEVVLSSFPRKRGSSVARPRDKDSHALQTQRSWIPAFAGMTKEEYHILDLGTGTGCLLLSLLHELPEAAGIGIDISPRAIEQAQKSAEKLGLNKRANFRTGNWLENITEKFDIIISNPPYIAAEDIAGLMPEVRDYDPVAALDGGQEGLEPYRFLIPQLKNFLNPQGIVAFEIGQGQAQQVADLFRQNGFTNIAIHKDLGGIERCVTCLDN